ncbi:AAA family ATPase [Photobacterium sp. BZF1]|nr:AAA family ATPase [Photobacterium sp. BZF1]MBC7003524.1 AAA family ATPase [Photobacterium sp. BZF1]
MTFWQLDVALSEYQSVLRALKAHLREEGYSTQQITQYFKSLPSDEEDFTSDVGQEVGNYLTNNLSDPNKELFEKLLTDRDWWFQPLHQSEQTNGKTLDRGDVFQSSFDLAARVIVANSSRLQTVVKAFSESVELREYFNTLSHNPVPYLGGNEDGGVRDEPTAQGDGEAGGDRIPFVNTGFNKIFYGAPGTGKSYSISQGRDEKQLIRTVFHPDTQYSDFVGCLKPVMAGDSVAYQFRPGPFTEAVIKAVNHPAVSFSLVIEEINRAAAAAVFGEIFQLLDREADGSSTYSIDVSDPDLFHYLNSETDNFFSDGKLKLPPNLSLLATMNSSDQAVMPMDTAFKRRWQFEYLRIDYSKASEGVLEFMVSDADGQVRRSFRWADFARAINDCLSAEHIPEDRLLGHRFISETELSTSPENTLTGKLFMYLWDDVLRHGQHTVVFRDSVTINGEPEELVNFGQLVVAFEQGAAVFNEVVEQRLKVLSDAYAQADEAAESQYGV